MKYQQTYSVSPPLGRCWSANTQCQADVGLMLVDKHLVRACHWSITRSANMQCQPVTGPVIIRKHLVLAGPMLPSCCLFICSQNCVCMPFPGYLPHTKIPIRSTGHEGTTTCLFQAQDRLEQIMFQVNLAEFVVIEINDHGIILNFHGECRTPLIRCELLFGSWSPSLACILPMRHLYVLACFWHLMTADPNVVTLFLKIMCHVLC